jgi:methionine transaminase
MQTKLPETRENYFWRMQNMALGQGAIDMSVGITEFICPPELAEIAAFYIREQFNNYTPAEGLLSLRHHVSEIYSSQYGKHYIPETEITICAGVVQALSSAITAVVNEGDEVIIFEPSYITYSPTVRLNGGTPVYVPLKEPDFRIDWEDVKKMITSKTRLIILNTPHNPTGSVLGKEDLFQLQRLTHGTGIYIIGDESFEYLIYDREKHQSLGQFENLASRSFIISSPGPVFHINGWGIAWCMAPENMMEEFRKVHECQVFNVNSPLQYALSEFLKTRPNTEEITEFYQGKRNYFNRLLKGSPLVIRPAQGTYFQLVEYSNVSHEPDDQFAGRLLSEGGVAAVPLSSFMHKEKNNHYLRFCFAKKNSTLEEAAAKLTAFCNRYTGNSGQ